MNKIHGGNIWKVSRESNLELKGIIDFSASINPLGLSPRAEEAIRDAVSLVRHYPEPDAETLRYELSLYHGLSRENILAGNGSTQFIYLIPQVFKPKKALIVEPAFSEYRDSLLLYGCEIDSFILNEKDNFIPDIGKLCDILKNKYDILYLGNPANPSGALLEREDVLALAKECEKQGTLLVVDEAFIDFVEHASVKSEINSFDNLIVLRSMTKFFSLAGMRLGYVIAQKKIIKNIEAHIPPWSVNSLAIRGGIESLKDNEYIHKTNDWLRNELPFLLQGLNAIPFVKTYPSMVNYILAKIVPPGIEAKAVEGTLSASGILIRDCSSFNGLDNRFFRVAVRRRDENMLLLDRIKAFIADTARC